MTPKEAWSGRRPSMNHLKVFGCVAYTQKLDGLRTKLELKDTKCVLLDTVWISRLIDS